MSDSVATAVAKSVQLSEWLQSILGVTMPNATRPRVVGVALANICLDHREAITALIGLNARTSAAALCRPMLEAYLRAMWALHIADDGQIGRFLNGRLDPPAEKFWQQLRRKHRYGELHEALRKQFGVFGDYTHGSARQVSRWISVAGVAPRHEDAEMVELLSFSDIIGLLACVERELAAERPVEEIETKLFDSIKLFSNVLPI